MAGETLIGGSARDTLHGGDGNHRIEGPTAGASAEDFLFG